MRNPYIVDWIRKNRKELIIHGLAYLFFGAIVAGIMENILHGTGFEKSVIILLTIIMLILVTLMPSLLIFFKRRLKTDALLNEIYGSTWRNSQYYQRKDHYTEEKYFLCEKLVKKYLAKALKNFYEEYNRENENNSATKINLIIDSGSTLVPIFEYLPLLDIDTKIKENLTIFTNNIAGIQELHRSPKDESTYNESNYYLIGGNPLQKYMATTIADSETTKKNLKILLDQHSGLNISIVTSNWVLGGTGLTELTLCAKGRGHYEFKEALLELSHYVIVVAPLGKILKIQTKNDLNHLIKSEEDYQSISLTSKGKSKIYLLTSFREESTLSPLKNHSKNLETFIKNHDQHNLDKLNYTFFEPILRFEPKGNEKEVYLKEIPHEYMRTKDNFLQAYGFDSKSL